MRSQDPALTATLTAGTAAAPSRGRLSGLSELTQPVIALMLVAGSILGAEWVGDFYWLPVFQLLALYVVASTFMGILLVDAGQVSFGNGAVFGVAAYAVGIACGIHGLPFWLGALLGVAAAVVVGLLFALPALRVQWFYLGFVTMGLAMVLPEMLYAFDRYTNGIVGISVLIMPLAETYGGISLLSILTCLAAAGAFACQHVLPRTRLGRRMRIAASSPECARSLRINPGAMRFTAFLISAAGTGVAGVLYPAVVGFVSPNAFPIDLSILFFFSIIVGGRGEILGTVVGVVLLHLVPNVLLAQFAQFRLFFYGLIALLIMLLLPKGVVGSVRNWRRGARPDLGRTVSQSFQKLNAAIRPREAGGAAGADALTIRNVSKGFGRVVAVDDVSITVRSGEIHGLVGTNGSGKSTLLNILSGFYPASSGGIEVRGHSTGTLSAREIAGKGVGRTFQTPRIFDEMTVWENLQVGVDAGRQGQALPFTNEAVEEVHRLLGREPVGSVAHGQRRLIEVVRVVLSGADILLMDEPAAGLSEDERRAFTTLLRRLRDDLGKTIVIVEHDLRLVWSIADHITVMDTGRVIASGTLAELSRDPVAAKLFVGQPHA